MRQHSFAAIPLLAIFLLISTPFGIDFSGDGLLAASWQTVLAEEDDVRTDKNNVQFGDHGSFTTAERTSIASLRPLGQQTVLILPHRLIGTPKDHANPLRAPPA